MISAEQEPLPAGHIACCILDQRVDQCSQPHHRSDRERPGTINPNSPTIKTKSVKVSSTTCRKSSSSGHSSSAFLVEVPSTPVGKCAQNISCLRFDHIHSAHPGTEHFRHDDRTISLLIIFHDRDQRAGSPSPDPFSVCRKRALPPSAGRYLIFARRAWKSRTFETDETSSHSLQPGAQTSISYVMAAAKTDVTCAELFDSIGKTQRGAGRFGIFTHFLKQGI